jgi:hypothetical protein
LRKSVCLRCNQSYSLLFSGLTTSKQRFPSPRLGKSIVLGNIRFRWSHGSAERECRHGRHLLQGWQPVSRWRLLEI